MGEKAQPAAVSPADREEEQRKKVAAVIAEKMSVLALGAPGVDRLSRRAVADPGRKKKMRKPAKGVRVSIKDEAIRMNIHIVVDFGKSIPDIARKIQNEAKSLIQREYPDYTLSAVNVWVDGVRFDAASMAYRREAIDTLRDLKEAHPQ